MSSAIDADKAYITGKFDQMQAALDADDPRGALKVLESIAADGHPDVVAAVLGHLIAEFPDVAERLLSDGEQGEPSNGVWIVRAGRFCNKAFLRNDDGAPAHGYHWFDIMTGEWLTYAEMTDRRHGHGDIVPPSTR